LTAKKILLPFVMVGLMIASCENDIKRVKELQEKKLGVDQGTKIESFLSHAGKMRAKLTAPLMLRYQFDSAKIEFPKTLHVDFYDSTLQVESQLFAKYGRYLENSNKIFLRDSVIIFNVRKDTLWCNELYWDQDKEQFYTDKPVVMRQHDPQQKIFAKDGMLSDQNFKNVTFKSVGKIYNGFESFINVKDSSY